MGGARYFGRDGKFPCPGMFDVISTSGVSPGLRPKRSELNNCRSVNRPMPVVLSGVMFRGRVRNGPI